MSNGWCKGKIRGAVVSSTSQVTLAHFYTTHLLKTTLRKEGAPNRGLCCWLWESRDLMISVLVQRCREPAIFVSLQSCFSSETWRRPRASLSSLRSLSVRGGKGCLSMQLLRSKTKGNEKLRKHIFSFCNGLQCLVLFLVTLAVMFP